MAGKLTKAQREQRSAAGRQSGALRSRATSTGKKTRAQLLPDEDKAIQEQLANYDLVAGKTKSWPDVKNREQVRAEIIRNETARLQLAEERGRLVDRKLVREAAAGMRDAIGRHLLKVPRQVGDGLALTLEQRAAVTRACEVAINAALDAAQADGK